MEELEMKLSQQITAAPVFDNGNNDEDEDEES
jgi:hypothetical protein